MADLRANDFPRAIRWENNRLFLLDQTQLPLAEIEEEQTTVEQVWNSIKMLKVRGAPAIGVAGAYGLVIGLQSKTQLDRPAFLAEAKRIADYLADSRPTAVNLKWGLQRLLEHLSGFADASSPELFSALTTEAEAIHAEDRALCLAIGNHGAPLIQDGMRLLTHCNAGALATSELGTALAPMYVAQSQGVSFSVFADETRPLLQGSRLTAWELQRAGVDVTVITDNAAAHLMSQGEIDLIITGADRVAANGDAANKIGTLGVAIAAKHFGIPFYIAIPYSTIDFAMPSGAGIPIEERDPIEVTHFGERRTAPVDIAVRSPAFDVTPHDLIAGFITDRGIVFPPYQETLDELFSEKQPNV